MTEEQIRAAWVGEPPQHNAPIRLAECDPSWPELFRRERTRSVVNGPTPLDVLISEPRWK
jgi:GrpB-like predicted nucleotidyltransferase (UPF0157 family)